MLSDKVRIITLPIGGVDDAERRVFSSRGELARIINGTTTIKHLVYQDLDLPMAMKIIIWRRE